MQENTMKNTISIGDVAIVSTRKQEYKKDDIILLQDQSGVKLERIADVFINDTTNTENTAKITKSYLTKADEAYYYNNFLIDEDMVIGKYIFKIAKIGWLLEIARSRTTTIVMIIILAIVLFLLLQIKQYNPSRSSRENKQMSLFSQIKLIFNKEDRKTKRIKFKHSRKVQKEEVNQRLEARRNRNKKLKMKKQSHEKDYNKE